MLVETKGRREGRRERGRERGEREPNSMQYAMTFCIENFCGPYAASFEGIKTQIESFCLGLRRTKEMWISDSGFATAAGKSKQHPIEALSVGLLHSLLSVQPTCQRCKGTTNSRAAKNMLTFVCQPLTFSCKPTSIYEAGFSKAEPSKVDKLVR